MKTDTYTYVEAPVKPATYGYGLKRVEVPTFVQTKPTTKRVYIKTLLTCMSYATAKVIFPKVEYPLMHNIRDLCRLGYLQRYVRVPKFKSRGRQPYFYKTTQLGFQLIEEAIKHTGPNGKYIATPVE